MKQIGIDDVSNRLAQYFHASKAVGKNARGGVFWEVTWRNKRKSTWIPDKFVNEHSNAEILDLLIKQL